LRENAIPTEGSELEELEIPPPDALFALTGLTVEDLRCAVRGERTVTVAQLRKLEQIFSSLQWSRWLWRLTARGV